MLSNNKVATNAKSDLSDQRVIDTKKQRGFLVLEGGRYFSGNFLGGTERAGEVVFNTSHTGYEEMSTDPSYFHQILVMTATQQGNYGASDSAWESSKMHIQGFVCLDIKEGLHKRAEWKNKLISYGVPILSGVDTRKLVLYLRQFGTVWGAIVRGETQIIQRAKHLIAVARAGEKDWPFMVATHGIREIKGKSKKGPRIAIIDFGVKHSIISQVAKRASAVCIFPPRVSAQNILKWKPKGIVLSNGPGNPKDVKHAVQTIKKLVGKIFMFGICMGHQILALALGGSTYKLKFGHRGGNHPVRDNKGTIFVTSQNHGYAVKDSLPPDIEVTHTNLNDGTVEGFFSQKYKCMGIQFHPESAPGPQESCVLFDTFFNHLKK